MSLKQPSTGVLVDGEGVVIVEILDAFFESRMLQTLVNGVGEQFDVRVERELVHGIDPSHVVHYKEENGSSLRTRPITLHNMKKYSLFDERVM